MITDSKEIKLLFSFQVMSVASSFSRKYVKHSTRIEIGLNIVEYKPLNICTFSRLSLSFVSCLFFLAPTKTTC